MIAKKIAIFTHSIENGTFAHISSSLIQGFKELGVSQCDLVVLNATDEEKANFPDINVISLNAGPATYSLMKLVRYLREHKPDVIFPMPWYFNVIAIWARMLAGVDTKVIMVEQNIISLEAGIEHKNNLKLKYLPVLMRHSYPYGHGLIAVGKDVITDLIKEVKVSRNIPMKFIPNPLDVEKAQQRAKEPVDHPWFQNKEIPVILTAARLAKQKQLDVLIRAFAQVLNVMPARLLILGKGPLKPELENLCRELQIEEHVAMPGYVSNPCSYMSACDVFVLASAWEGCPVAVEEALASGAPIIVNDAPGGSKDLVDYGKYGMIVPNGDEKALTEAIVKLISDPILKKYYQEQSRHRAWDFHYLNISKQYLDFYTSLLVKSGN
jgi:glycosyltransferase involved in cell wall biosynthesis